MHEERRIRVHKHFIRYSELKPSLSCQIRFFFNALYFTFRSASKEKKKQDIANKIRRNSVKLKIKI